MVSAKSTGMEVNRDFTSKDTDFIIGNGILFKTVTNTNFYELWERCVFTCIQCRHKILRQIEAGRKAWVLGWNQTWK